MREEVWRVSATVPGQHERKIWWRNFRARRVGLRLEGKLLHGRQVGRFYRAADLRPFPGLVLAASLMS